MGEVVEALVALRVGGGLSGRQEGDKLVADEQGVLHLVLGRARMDVDAVDDHLGPGGVEVLILQLAQLAAVHRVGHRRAEALDVEAVGARAHLLVGGKAYRDAAVGDLRMSGEVFHGRDDLRHARLVVRPQQGGAVGDDQILPHVLLQALKLTGAHDDALLLVEHDVPALVADDPGLDSAARRVGRGVHMGDEPHAGDPLTPGGGGQPGVHIALLGHVGVLEPHLGQLGRQGTAQYLLLLRGGHGGRVLIGLGIIGDVLQKTVDDMHASHFLSRLPLPLFSTQRHGQVISSPPYFTTKGVTVP